MQVSQQAQDHEPIGDKEHSAYGEDYVWTCTCGRSGGYIYNQSKAEHKAQSHEQYCNGETTVKTIYE